MAFYRYAASVAALGLCAQPCLAADDMRIGTPEARTGAFAGAQLRLPIGRGHAERPSARLQLTTIRQVRDAQTGAIAFTARASGVELGSASSGRPSLFIGGQRVSEMEKRLQLGSKGTTLAVVGGVLLVVVVLAAVASALPQPGPREGAFD